jgi:lipopolysaccharide export system protein LptA
MNYSLPMLCFVGAMALMAAPAGAQMKKNTPIEISSDSLDVLQTEHKAIFSGNVIAIQGTTTMRAAKMTVFYRDSESKAPAPAPTTEAAAPAVQGIYRIDADGNVVFTTPTETAMGDKAIYNVDTDTIDVMGGNVTLTRGQNILKGTKLNYNMTTGRSILTGGGPGGVDVTGKAKPARVHGLFMPKADPKTESKP